MANEAFTTHVGEIRDFKHLMVPEGETPWLERHAAPSHPVDVLLHLGCNILRTAHLAYEVVAVFQALGIRFTAVGGPQYCCGVVHQRAGDTDGAVRIARSTVAQFESSGARQVVIWCPTCQIRFEEAMEKGIVPRFSMTHATAFLAGEINRLSFGRDLPARVALHGHVGKPQREMDSQSAIRVLQSVPGVKVVGVLSSSQLEYHCSPALLTQLGAEGFRSVRADLVRKAWELDADTLATLYHSCHREWCEISEGGPKVRNYISIVAEALGCGRRDSFQEYKKLRDPDAIAALSRPVWETHGLSEGQARELAIRYFAPRKA
jgi:heterodisulfide reductase subunit D